MRTILGIPLCAIAGLALVAGCDSSPPPQAAAPAATATPFHTEMDVKQLMGWIVDPNATGLWNSVATIDTESGREERQPHTDEEWNAVRNHAAVLVESGNLLMLSGRAVDQGDWIKFSRGLSDAASTALQAAEVKDVQALFDAGGVVYEACSACHAKYLIVPPEQKAPQ